MTALGHMHAGGAGEMGKRKRLVALLTRHQRTILRYIHSLVPHVQDAEDLFQETCEVICEKFDTFVGGGKSPGPATEDEQFLAWACEIAWWRVRAARTDYARSRVLFSEQVMRLVEQTTRTMAPEMDLRGEALEECLKKLPARDRELIQARYQPGASVEEAASRNGRSLEAAYKALARARRVLYECVSRRLALRDAAERGRAS